MRYETTARDFFYETSGVTALTYYITCEGVTIYSGVAVKSPNEPNLRINISRRVSDYLHTSMPDFRDFDGVVVPHPEQLMEFILFDGDSAELERYRVLYEFGGEWNGDYYDLSFPIDGKADPRQKIFWGAIEEGEEVIVIDTESGSTTGSTTGCCENVPQMTYDLPYATTYSNSEIDFYSPSVSGGCEILSFSTDEEAQAAGYPAAGYYLSGYTGSTSVIPIEITDHIFGGVIETVADGNVRVFPELNGKVRKIVAPYAERLSVEGGFGSDYLNGVNADNASNVRIAGYFADDLNPRTYYENLRNLCFYNAIEAGIYLGRSLGQYSESSGNTSPVLESIELPNATKAAVYLIGSNAFNRLDAPKLKTGKIYLGGTSITGVSFPDFEREFVPTGGTQTDEWLRYGNADFSFTNCTGITSADTIFGPNYKGLWGTFMGCTGIESFSSNVINSIQMKSDEYPVGIEGGGTFERCTSLQEVNLPALRYAGPFSFAYCTSLTYIHFPNLETLDAFAFYGCSNITEINLPKLKSISLLGVFEGCSSLKNITVHFEELFGYPGNGAGRMFDGCTSLESVTLDGPIDDSYEIFGTANNLKTIVFTNIEQWGGHSTNSHIGTDIPESVTDVYFPSNLSLIATWDALSYPYNPITAIHYDGTKSQWNSILYSQGYPQRISVIHCTDGDIIP